MATTEPANHEDQAAALAVAATSPHPAARRLWPTLLFIWVVQAAASCGLAWATADLFRVAPTELAPGLWFALLLSHATVLFFIVDLNSSPLERRSTWLALGLCAILLLHVLLLLLAMSLGDASTGGFVSLFVLGFAVLAVWPVTTYLRLKGWRLTDAPVPPAPLLRYSIRRGLLALCGGAVCLAIARWFYTHDVEVYAFLQPLGRRLAFNWLNPGFTGLFGMATCVASALVMLRTHPRLVDALLTLTLVTAVSVWMCLQSRSFARSDDFVFVYLYLYASIATMASLWGLRWLGWRFERIASPPATSAPLESPPSPPEPLDPESPPPRLPDRVSDLHREGPADAVS